MLIGWRPPELHLAAKRGDAERVRCLLAAAPDPATLAASTDRAGQTAVHFAIQGREPGCLEALRLLLTANPALATAAVGNGSTPLHSAASRSHLDAVRLLLATAQSAAAHLAAAADNSGLLPLHYAASAGRDDIVQLLLEAAPGTAVCRNSKGHTPLDWALGDSGCMHEGYGRTARLLIAAPGQRPGLVLQTLNRIGPAVLPVYSVVASHHSLSADDWQLVPSPCHGLAAALPAVLQRSPAEAALLVSHLPDFEKHRLRTDALALHCAQARCQVWLPQPLAWHILALAMS